MLKMLCNSCEILADDVERSRRSIAYVATTDKRIRFREVQLVPKKNEPEGQDIVDHSGSEVEHFDVASVADAKASGKGQSTKRQSKGKGKGKATSSTKSKEKGKAKGKGKAKDVGGEDDEMSELGGDAMIVDKG
jgi:hypothetical protein